MTPLAVFLADRGVVRVEGADATDFLQGMLTNDVARLVPGEARYAALLTPRARSCLIFLRSKRRESRQPSCWIARPRSPPISPSGLAMYKLRAKVAIADESARLGVVADWGDGVAATGGLIFADPRAEGLGRRAILPRAQAQALGEAGLATYEALRIRLGAPKGGVDFAYGDAFPA